MDSTSYNSPYVLSYRRYLRKKNRKPTKIETLKQSVKNVTKEYCAESSICGLKHIVDDNASCFERTIWIITMISGLICSVSLVWITFMRYYQAPLVTTQMPEGVSVSKIIFPAVGICTNNRISKSAIEELARKLLQEERNKNYTEKQMLSLLLGLGFLYNQQPMNEKLVQPMKLHHALGEYDVNELMRNLTPRCEDLLLRCAWNEIPMNCSDLFDFRLTMNGYCCTFNYLRQSDITFEDKDSGARSIDMYKYGNKSNFDFGQGLKALIKLNTTDDFYYNMPLQGAQLQFSDAYDFPDAPSGSFAMQIVNPSVEMVVLVTASFTEASRDIQHVPTKLRRCLFYDESSYLPFYTHSDCLLKCRMLFLLAKCKCTPFNMPKMVNNRTCDMRDIPCLKVYNAQSTTVRPDVDMIPPELELDMVGGGINCPMCYPSCSKTAYSYDFMNTKIWPDYLNTVPDNDRIDWLRGANFTGTSMVHVKYAREVADCYGQNVIMKWFDLISNIGSTCGFVTGFSFVSVIEFIYFYTVKLYREISNRHRQEKRITSETSTVNNFEPISRYRPIYWNELGGSTQWKRGTPY
ncbi:sodium channel protein Nach-like [Nymphalis io]|uniref:sodium channel protein Nach-like n=1 Tax=Inachis io TaxID=171585 RepID=UPI002166E129|nr:sodium channel protein Nach-like [Nymphalis io]